MLNYLSNRPLALSADGRLAVSASWDKTLKVWDVTTGRELHTLTGHSDKVRSVVMSADGRLAVSESDDMTLKVWDIKSGRELQTLKGHNSCVALSADGRLAVSISSYNSLKVWEVATGHELRTLTGHRQVNDVALSADGQMAVSASDDMTLKVWDVETGRELCTLIGHSGKVRSVVLSADGRLAVSASDDMTLKVWDISIALAQSAQTSKGEEVNTDAKKERGSVHMHSTWVKGVALSADGQVAISMTDAEFRLWRISTVNNAAMVTIQRMRRLTDNSDSILVHSNKPITLKKLHKPKMFSEHYVALSEDERLAVSVSGYDTHKVWDVETGRELLTTESDRSADGRLRVSGTKEGTIIVWDVSYSDVSYSERELRTLTGHSDSVRGVALSADEQMAVSASGDKTLKVWDVRTGHELRTLTGHSDSVSGVALNADGRLAVSASGDKTLKVWDVRTGHCIATLLIGTPLNCCAMSADGKTIVAGDSAGGVHFLELFGADELLAKDIKIEKSWLALKKESESRS